MFSGRGQKVRFLSGLGTFRKHEDDYLNNSYLGGRKHRVRLRPGGNNVWSFWELGWCPWQPWLLSGLEWALTIMVPCLTLMLCENVYMQQNTKGPDVRLSCWCSLSTLIYLVTLQLHAGYLTLLGVGFLICKMRLEVLTEDWRRKHTLSTQSGTEKLLPKQ